eukprot:TRINITY_DN8287_c0_g1_i1.p1 TRINITY_DN8287_c0_g1~~TRINITY_DN8287_c0_g1_i1.p1  ORF type:complete len:354 (+),score=108.92 TRINITY_DN8287_c0_g1_i1:57-1064(+)
MAAAALCLMACGAMPGFGVPVRRGLRETEFGYMHYVASKRIDARRPTLVLYHANPRSVSEFSNFLSLPSVSSAFNFVAADYFGQGFSDDCSTCAFNTSREYVSLREWVDEVEGVLREELGVAGGIIPVGDLKGGYAAIEHCRILRSSCRAVVAVGPVWFSPETAQKVIDYAKHTRNAALDTNGAHLLQAWHQPSAAPCDRVNSTYCAVDCGASAAENEAKTVDRLRALQTQWQYVVSGLEYNDELLAAAEEIAGRGTPRLVVWGTRAVFDMWVGDGFDPDATVPPVNAAFGAANNTRSFTGPGVMIRNLADGSEGVMVQNASVVAAYLSDLLHQH